ncbi:MAG: DUF6588 family protein [Elusimicrobiota bacterium]
MRKAFAVFVVSCLVAGTAFSATLDFDELVNKLEKEFIESLANDIGSVLAGGMFHSGRTLPILPGIDLGLITATSLEPSADDEILKTSMGDKLFGLPFVQLSKGLPKSFELTLRGFPETQGVEMLGVGVKYGIIEKELAVVKMGLSAMYSYNQLTYATFKANTNSVAGIFSVSIPVIEPYLGVAMDTTKLETKFDPTYLTNYFTNLDLPVKGNLSATGTALRGVLGLNFSLLPFTYINVAGTYLIDHFGIDFGLGVNF